MIQAVAEPHQAVAADAPPGGFDSGQIVGRGWEADRAAGIGAKRATAKARGHGDARAAGRNAGPMVRAPGIIRSRQAGIWACVAPSVVWSLAIRTAPAAFSRLTTVASSVGLKSFMIAMPAVV